MRIVLLNDDFPPNARGGAGVVAFNMARGLKDAGHQVFVITTVRAAEAAGETTIDGIPVFRLQSAYPERWRAYVSLRNPQTVGRVERILDDLKPDIVHAHNLHQYLSYHCLKLAKRAGAKVFLTAHDALLFHYGKLHEFVDADDPACLPHPDYRISAWRQLRAYRSYYNPFRNFFIRRRLKYLDGVFAVSQALKDALEQNGIVGAEVIHNGIDPDFWRSHKHDAAAFVGAHGLRGRKVVLCSGRMNELKGLGHLIEAMRIVKRSVPEAILVVGGGNDAGRRPDGNIGDAVFTDWMTPEAMRDAIHASAVVAIPSLYLDPFPTAALEAMACGKPVIATCFGGAKEAVVDGLTGTIVNPHDIKTMADKIVELLKDPSLAARLGTAGLARVRSEFSLQRQVLTTLRRYQDASDGNTAG